MEPHEVLASESQERMLLIVEPSKVDSVLAVAEKWGVLATALGTVTDTGRLVINWRGEPVVDVPPGSLADDGPVYARPMREPGDLILLNADRAETLPRPKTGDELRETVLRLAASPNLCDKTWVTEQYDRYVLGNTVLAQPEDSGVIRIDEESGLGIALSLDGNGRFARLDPYNGAKLALAEAYRNVAVTGATPVAVSPTAARNWASRLPAATSASTTRPAPPRSTRRRSSGSSAYWPTWRRGCRWASRPTGTC
jgi:phosphoribosylformylglycinamidine synthase